MYSQDETAVPKDLNHFWEMAERNFESAQHVLEDYPLESKEDAVQDEHHAPMLVIAYRNVSSDYDQRSHYFEMGRSLLPEVRRLLDLRQLSPEFCQQWGKLMFCHGFIASYVFDDSDDVAPERNAQKSAAVRSPDLHQRWLAHLFGMEPFAGLPRETADYEVGLLLAQLRSDPGIASKYPPNWFERLLTEGNFLRSAFTGKNLLVKDLKRLRALGTDGLPPLPDQIS